MTHIQESSQELGSTSHPHESQSQSDPQSDEEKIAVVSTQLTLSSAPDAEHTQRLLNSPTSKLHINSRNLSQLHGQHQTQDIQQHHEDYVEQVSEVSEANIALDEKDSEPASSLVPPWPPRGPALRSVNPTHLLDKFIHVVTSESSSPSSSPSPTPFHVPDNVEHYRKKFKSDAPAISQEAGQLSHSGATMLVVATPSASDNSGIMSAIDQLDKTTIAPMSFEEWKNRVSIHRKRKPQMPSPPSIESADLDEEDIEVDDDDFEEDEDDLDMDGVEYTEDEMDDAASDLVDHHDIYHAPTIINNDDSVKKAEFHTPKRKRRIRRFGAWTILTDPSARGSQRLSFSPTLSDITTHHLDSTPTSPKTTIIDPGVQAEQSNPYELHEESPYSSQNRDQDNHAETGDKVSNDGAQETVNHEEAGTESVDGGAHSEVEREDGTLKQDADGGDNGQAEEDPNVQLQQLSSTIKDVEEYHEEDYESNPLDSMGLVTPRRKNKRSLCTPPPAPKSPNEYIVKRYVFTRGHNPDDSPSATRINMRTISHR